MKNKDDFNEEMKQMKQITSIEDFDADELQVKFKENRRQKVNIF